MNQEYTRYREVQLRGYEKYRYRPYVKELKETVLICNKKLRALNLHDHQVESLDRSNSVVNFWRFTTRFFKFSLFMGLSLPGIFLFSPVFIISRRILRERLKRHCFTTSYPVLLDGGGASFDENLQLKQIFQSVFFVAAIHAPFTHKYLLHFIEPGRRRSESIPSSASK
ncbi:hypothetical protein CORT_0A10150 [Candida orthopsilosis Co 90-125]|uniref:Uncharacterized protein n=1 Tax=Candida orthopsilosis (strain 90-125) TaxID=1136231 RepID=H8WX95_CANO9|nr:hypothetical protein CORT_0A10150 [Candida orthopsilosis Co 90-125]CCG21400.1 hypothetical protein CORT_0A10150 [Candida orthopsilosis Co 90-125]